MSIMWNKNIEYDLLESQCHLQTTKPVFYLRFCHHRLEFTLKTSEKINIPVPNQLILQINV